MPIGISRIILATVCFLFSLQLAFAQAHLAKTNFIVTIAQPANGSIKVTPPLPADGKVPAGTVLTVKISPAPGYVIDSGYSTVRGPWSPAYQEFFTKKFRVTVDQDRSLGASFIEKKALEGFTVMQDVIYAKPGVKKLKYDVFSPKGAKNLPCIIIIHGGGWIWNTEDIMRGLARELVRDGKYVVFSIDYRWIGTLDGDKRPNTLADIIGDVYGAIAHIQEHAKKYGGDPTRIAVTGDSAGGHLAAAAITLVDQIGDAGFGIKEGVYEFKPAYMPHGESVTRVREEITHALKAAAPSYGVFSAARIAEGANATNQPLAELKAMAPIEHIPNIRERAVPQFLLRGQLDSAIKDSEMRAYANALKAAGQTVEYIQIEGAEHAFLDWKPNAETKMTFQKYGEPAVAQMESFFNSVFYR